MATADHLATDEASAVLLDADLAVLGAQPAAYLGYVRGIRAEYSFVDEPGWRAGRSEVLRRFLEREELFHTVARRGRTARARANLAAELAGLDQ